ncbi:MAG: Adaptive-response sensory-kinase SasA [Anaerolineales bacterium]|nr:Adaptive-response sensory-kinase SasA [Anaerolineales bacterium]
MFKRWLTPPVFEDDAQTNRAYILHVILWALVAVPVPYLIYSFFKTPEQMGRVLAQSLFGEAANIIALYILRRGQVQAASILQAGLFWLFLTVTSFTGGGVQSEAYLLGYSIVIVIAGILLGGRGASIFTALSLASGALMMFAYSQGRLSPEFKSSASTTWIVSLLFFPVVAILQHLASGTLRSALRRARRSEERYRLISRVSSDYVFSSREDAHGILQLEWVAGAFETITGYTYEEYVANGGWRAHIHPDDLAKDLADTNTIKTNQPVVTEIRFRRKDRSLRWARVYAHPVWDEAARRVTGIVGAVQDITEQKQIEADRESLIRELEAKNAELERFTYTVSHDLKSPIITIKGFLGYVEKDAREGNLDMLASSIQRVNKAADKMQELLNDLLELSRIGRLMNPPSDVPFGQIVREALEMLHGALDAKRVRVKIQEVLPSVRGDRVRLTEVVQNLVENAVKFMGDQPAPMIQIGAQGLENGKPIFFVRDNGQGFDPQFAERIFGLFNKLDPHSEGTGIGLTLVKRIVEFHGGRIWAESTPGQGAAFYFTLPITS